MKKIFQNPIYPLTYFIFLAAAVLFAYLTYSNLDKGFIFNDEAYYLSYYKNTGESLSFDRTNFFRIFKFLYTPNIYHFRIISITLLVLSNFLFCFTIFKYFKFKQNIFLLSLLGIFIGFETWSISNLIIQQYIGNTILINIGVSVMLFAIISKKQIFLVFSGFILAFVLFNGNSHSIIIVPVLAFLFLQNRERWKPNFTYFLSGFVVGIVVYFMVLDTLDNFMYQLKFLKEYLTFHRKQHSKTFMVLWCVYLFLNGILPAAITYFLLWKSKIQIKTLDKFIAGVGVFCLILYIFFTPYYIYLFILLAHLMALRFWFSPEESKQSKYLIILLLIIPYCLAFGSQTWFHLRLNVYKFYYFSLILIIIIRLYKSDLWLVGYLIFMSFMILRFPSVLNDKGWKDFVFTEQTEKVKINGYDLYLDKGRKKDIEDLRPYLQNKKNVIYSSNHLMGYLYILDASPPIYYYFTLKDYLLFIIKKSGKTPDDCIYIESNDYPFSPKEIVPLEFVNHPENYHVIKTGRFTIYQPANHEKK